MGAGATVKNERSSRRRRRGTPATGPAPRNPSHTLHLVAHPADALAVTGTALFGALGEPDRAVTVVCLIPAPPQARDHLLDVIGRGGPWERATEPLGPDAVLHLFRLRTRPATRVCFTEPSQPSQPSQPSERVHPSFAGLAAALLRRFAPTLVCTLDPDPEHLAWNEAEGAVYADHPDHAAVAGASWRRCGPSARPASPSNASGPPPPAAGRPPPPSSATPGPGSGPSGARTGG